MEAAAAGKKEPPGKALKARPAAAAGVMRRPAAAKGPKKKKKTERELIYNKAWAKAKGQAISKGKSIEEAHAAGRRAGQAATKAAGY